MCGAANTVTVLGADDSGGYRSLQPERTADCQNPIANLHTVGIPKFSRRKLFVGVNLDYRQIRVVIRADDPRGVACCIVIQLDLNLGSVFDDVIVGENITTLVDDDARAEAPFRLRRGILAAVKKAIEEILHGIVVIAGIVRRYVAPLARGLSFENLGGSDINDRGLD